MLAREGQDLRHEVPGPQTGGADLLQVSLKVGVVARRDASEFTIAEDAGEQVVEVVGDAARERAEALQFLRLLELRLQAVAAFDAGIELPGALLDEAFEPELLAVFQIGGDARDQHRQAEHAEHIADIGPGCPVPGRQDRQREHRLLADFTGRARPHVQHVPPLLEVVEGGGTGAAGRGPLRFQPLESHLKIGRRAERTVRHDEMRRKGIVAKLDRRQLVAGGELGASAAGETHAGDERAQRRRRRRRERGIKTRQPAVGMHPDDAVALAGEIVRLESRRHLFVEVAPMPAFAGEHLHRTVGGDPDPSEGVADGAAG